uniref:Immunoglobulin subtype domain-containing protein n=1 Tax=Parascaris equorum TaxID=6256 RepID=A0A914RY73_PAREQ
LFSGPEEGPPRKKIKSPPVISPTGSSTSLYSGGSSSIDWTTTGTTLDMQGTRVTRTQYGFRTLQESSAKMCLKVTGYPLPDITWLVDVASPPPNNVEGWPEPELLWLVDEQPLRPSHDFRLEYDGQNAKLEIRDAQPEDTGVYTVRIKNEYGSAESNAKLVVQPDPDRNHVAPEFQATIEDVECDEGDTVRFKAVLTGDPNPEVNHCSRLISFFYSQYSLVTWLVNGIPLSESDKIKFISEDGICIVTIQDVSRHFDGVVTCQGVNRLGSQSCDGRLKEGHSFMLEAELNGFPDPAVMFSVNANAEKHDGEVVCTAINEHGQAESRARVVVEPVEEESRSAPTFTVKYGENAVFETSVRGNPKPEVIWFLNGQRLDKFMPGVTIETLNASDHRLTLDSTQYAGTVRIDADPKEKLTWILNGEELHESTIRKLIFSALLFSAPSKYATVLEMRRVSVDFEECNVDVEKS